MANQEETKGLSKKEEAIIDGMLDTMDEMSPECRVEAFGALLANYCHECGQEQPDDPEQECPCMDDEEEEDEDEDTDLEDLEDEDDEDEDDEDEDEDEDEEEEDLDG